MEPNILCPHRPVQPVPVYIPPGTGFSVICGRCAVFPVPGLGVQVDGRERLRSFRFLFCASSCFLFFFTEGFS